MLEIKSKNECCGCSACANICPKQCIYMQVDDEGFWYPEINAESCVGCDLCTKVCPILNLNEENKDCFPTAYAANNKNDQVRMYSSSGGIFMLIAEEIIRQNGVVFGATLSKDCYKVYHLSVECLEDLCKLQGSKYSQSWIGDIFLEVKRQLKNGRKVLFSGTPCQVEGLKTFLNKSYSNLLCVDFICHGVPSPKVWEKYVLFREKSAGSSTKRMFFRNKKYGWKTYTVLFEFSNNTVYEQIFSTDLFMQSFLQNSCLRPSCHNCKFKKINRFSDITLADFWGVHDVVPEMDDNKGTSLIFIHSKKGLDYWNRIGEFMKIAPVDTLTSIKENSAMILSAIPNKKRADFFANVDNMEFDKLVACYARKKFEVWIFVTDWCRKVGITKVFKNIFKHKCQ